MALHTLPETLDLIKNYLNDPEHADTKDNINYLFNLDNPHIAMFKKRGNTCFMNAFGDINTYFSSMISHWHLEDWSSTVAMVNFLQFYLYLVHAFAEYLEASKDKIITGAVQTRLQYGTGAAKPENNVMFVGLGNFTFNFWNADQDPNSPARSSYINVTVEPQLNYYTFGNWDGDFDTLLSQVRLKTLVKSAWIDAKRTTITETASTLLLDGALFDAVKFIIDKIRITL